MAIMGTGHFGKALWPGINAWYGQKYKEWPTRYTSLFDTHKSSKHYEEDVGVSGMGLAQVVGEGEPVTYDSERQAFVTRYTHVKYGLGFIITKELYEDDLYSVAGERRSKGLAKSMRQTKETVGANVYNRAFNASYLGGDGLELCSLLHVNFSGGTWANELTTAADLSEASLEQAFIDIRKLTDDRGLKAAVMPKSLIIPVDLEFEAERILKSPYRVGTADNDINAIKTMGKLPGGVIVDEWLTDTDAWFIRTDADHGMKYFTRVEDSFAQDNDFDTDNAKYKARARYSFGWSDPRGLFGCPGA